ncbi:MAG: ATP-binding protein [Oligoflexia bacterium]|nr:ATP-binding protein [Oligoflexia bacterium]
MKRSHYIHEIRTAFRSHPVVALLGPRQVGKSTLAREIVKTERGETHLFDLEDPTDLARLETPKLALEDLRGMIIIDEIQKRPDLFPLLRVLADRGKSHFLILGSASPQLIGQSSESLAGRLARIEVRPFTMIEKVDLNRLWLRGGFPKAYLAKSENDASMWLKHYVSAFLEIDLPQLGVQIPATTLRKFWLMLTHYHGAQFNASEIGGSLGISGPTARRYLDLLSQTFMVRELQPWHANIAKRQVKTPKVYIRDTGLLHILLGLSKVSEIKRHPKLGLSWEGFVLEQITSNFDLGPQEVFYWGTHAEAELDLFCVLNGRKVGFEIKYTDAPKITRSMRIASQDLKLDELFVIYPGAKNFRMDNKITAIGFDRLVELNPRAW